MSNRLAYAIVVVVAVLAFSSVVVLAQDAQPRDQNRGGAQQNAPARASKTDAKPSGPAPVHDFSGMWTGPAEAQLSNRIPPMTPAGQAHLKLNIPDPFSASSNDPWKTCDPFGMPRVVNNGYGGGGIGFAQMPDRIIMLHDYSKVWREIWMDGRPLPKNVGHTGGPSSMIYGYSVGHWEGDNTLVVDTIGMDDKTWVDRRGYPHSVDAHVVERYTRTDHDHLTVTETLDDPVYYTQPFLLAKTAYTWVRGQDDLSAPIPFTNEQICVPSEMIEYYRLLAVPADEDAATGQKTNNKK
jgi:hypothetical protein